METMTLVVDGLVPVVEYLNLSDASEAEREILNNMLFKNPSATQTTLFASLKLNPGQIIPPISTNHRGINEKNYHSIDDIPILPSTLPYGGYPATSLPPPGQNGHAHPPGTVVLIDSANVGQGPIPMRPAYSGGQMLRVTPNLIYQQMAAQPYPASYHHQYQYPPMGLPPPHVLHPPPHVGGFPTEDLGQISSKSHETLSNSSSSNGKGYGRKGPPRVNRGRDEPPQPMNPCYYHHPNVVYGHLFYNPAMAANVTGQPIILPGTAQQGPNGPMYQPPTYQPQMYNPGAEIDQSVVIQPSPVSQLQSTPTSVPILSEDVTNRSQDISLVNDPPKVVPGTLEFSIPMEGDNDSHVPVTEESNNDKTYGVELAEVLITLESAEALQNQLIPTSAKIPSDVITPIEDVQIPAEFNGDSDDSSCISQSDTKKTVESEKLDEVTPSYPSKMDNISVSDVLVNGPFPMSSENSGKHSPPNPNGPPSSSTPRPFLKEKENPEFPQLTTSGGVCIAVVNGPNIAKSSSNQAPPSHLRSWASIASSKHVNGPSNGILVDVSGSGGRSNSRIGYETEIGTNDLPTPNIISTSTTDPQHTVYNTSPFDTASLDDKNDPLAISLGEFLSKYPLNHHSLSLTPRGLVNQSNFCYINATLQSLLACPPFVNLFRAMRQIIGDKTSKATPILQSVYDFVMEFDPITRSNHNNKTRRPQDAFYVGPNLDPTGIRRVLTLFDGATFKVEGRQEDAEEFLSHLLNGLHDEMIKTIRWYEAKKERTNYKVPPASHSVAVNGEGSSLPFHAGNEEDDEWQVMGPKNKGSMTRKTEVSKSPISEMFVGQMSSLLNRGSGTLPKTTTLQPFFTLQLDIQDENIHSVREALECLSTKEEVGSSGSNGQETLMWKQLSLELLPIILVIHLKRFVYDKHTNKISKLDKRVDFAVDLEIGKELLSINCKSKTYNSKQRSYKLFAAVYHDGEEAHKGHYIADTFHPSGGSLWGQFGWIRYDDTVVKGVPEAQILNPQPPRVPYLLYYRRVDTLSTGKKGPMMTPYHSTPDSSRP